MSQLYQSITKCRISGSENLVPILNLGNQALTGVFPPMTAPQVPSGPLELVWCPDSGLVQLGHTYNSSMMYGDNYGYRSGLNNAMVEHLTQKVGYLEHLVQLNSNDIVLDIGSNDATTLKAYQTNNIRRVGIDPSGQKFSSYYPVEIKLVPDFFSADAFYSVFPNEKAKIVTSIAMFYDLEDPISFARQIESILTDDGIWHFEQSYLPSMLRQNSYDTICHEHLEYYSLKAINYILEQADLDILDFSLNNVNGGSIAVTAGKKNALSSRRRNAIVDWQLEWEEKMGYNSHAQFLEFEARVVKQKESLVSLIKTLVNDGKKIFGYGASTKGNVTLQYCGITNSEITAIADVNVQKFGCCTPGTNIPIVSEADALAMKPDYYLVLPWHFRDGILKREREFIANGGKFIFPFPEIEIV